MHVHGSKCALVVNCAIALESSWTRRVRDRRVDRNAHYQDDHDGPSPTAIQRRDGWPLGPDAATDLRIGHHNNSTPLLQRFESLNHGHHFRPVIGGVSFTAGKLFDEFATHGIRIAKNATPAAGTRIWHTGAIGRQWIQEYPEDLVTVWYRKGVLESLRNSSMCPKPLW